MDFEHIFAALCGFLFGLALGSFASMASFRLPRRMGWMGRSFCDGCGIPLEVRDLIPVATWVARRGRCRCGGVRIGVRYPLLELCVAFVGVLIGLKTGMTMEFVLLMLLLTTLAVVVTIDLEHMVIPDGANLVIGLLGINWMVLHNGNLGLAAAASAMLFTLTLLLAMGYAVVRGKEMVGGGDVKFMTAAGFWLTFDNISLFLLLAGFVGAAFGVVWNHFYKTREFPFGPALAVALMGTLLLK